MTESKPQNHPLGYARNGPLSYDGRSHISLERSSGIAVAEGSNANQRKMIIERDGSASPSVAG
jgi:hypothetical protein